MKATFQRRAILLWLSVSAMAAPNPAIDVRFSNQSSATDLELAELEATTGQLFARGGIDISWSHCFDRTRHLTPDPGCQAPAGPSVVILSLVDAAPKLNRNLLGISALGTGRATIFYMHARMIVKSPTEEVSVGQLLGDAAAHEIVHLIVGPDHSAFGLMKEAVSFDDLRDMAQGRRWFGQAELDQVRSALMPTQTEIARSSTPPKHRRIITSRRESEPAYVSFCNNTGISEKSISLAQKEIDVTYRAAGVEVHWVGCDDMETALKQYGNRLFVIRLRNESSHKSVRSVSLDTMGRAYTEERGSGYMADVYIQSIVQFGETHNIEVETLLGLVICHELGHLVLGPGHSGEGIMFGQWREREAEAGRKRWLRFTPQQAAIIVDQLQRRGQ